MDAYTTFTTIVAPVAMTAETHNREKRRKTEYKKGLKPKEKDAPETLEYAAVYIPTGEMGKAPPPTYNKPVTRKYA